MPSSHSASARWVADTERDAEYSTVGAVVVLQCIRQPTFDLIDTRQIRRMRGETLGNGILRAEAQFPDHLFGTAAHAFPERHRFARVISGLRHQLQADVIRFRFMLAIERQGHVDAIGPQYTLDGTSPLPARPPRRRSHPAGRFDR